MSEPTNENRLKEKRLACDILLLAAERIDHRKGMGWFDQPDLPAVGHGNRYACCAIDEAAVQLVWPDTVNTERIACSLQKRLFATFAPEVPAADSYIWDEAGHKWEERVIGLLLLREIIKRGGLDV